MARKSSIDRLPPPVRVAIDDALAENRLTLDEILEQISIEYGETNTPSRSAIGRRKQRVEKILAKHRQTNEVMATLMRSLGKNDGSQMSRGVIELLRYAVHDVAEEIASDDEPNAKAVGALALAMQRLAKAEEVTVNVEKRIREEVLQQVEDQVSHGPRQLDAQSLEFVRRAIRGDDK